MAGKRVRAPAVHLADYSPTWAPLIYVKDTTSNVRYLVDSGAALSILPHRSVLPPSGPAIVNANGGLIPSWNFVTKQLHFGPHHFSYSFLQANVSQPILGADFLKTNSVTVDFKEGRLHFPNKQSSSPLPHPNSPSSTISSQAPTPHSTPEISALLSRFPSVSASSTSSWPQPKHGTIHSIHTTGPPLAACARRLSPCQLTVAKDTFTDLERLSIIRRSASQWSTPLHMVPKPNGSWRPCGDYRCLNTVTTADKYLLPNLQDLSAHLHGATVFSKLDLEKDYYQIPMDPADIPKTAIITPFGLFEFCFMPFSLKNAAQTFQRLMDSLFRDCPFVFIYLDDILIFSKDKAEHFQHLNTVFQILADSGLRLNPAKCTFAASEIDCLGHRVTATGLASLSFRIQPILNFPLPSDVKSLQQFLGMLNFYRRFLPGIACILKPLTDACKGSGSIQWTEHMQAAFQSAKSVLASAVPLQHPKPSATLSLATDASDTHVGAVLQQRARGSWQPLTFFSHKLSPTEARYSTFDCELLAAFLSVRHFRVFLEGCPFTLITDHKPLVAAISKTGTPFSSRQQRHLSFLSEFSATFLHLPGSNNIVADFLSRPSQPPSKPSL
jgi:hypothetical protein